MGGTANKGARTGEMPTGRNRTRRSHAPYSPNFSAARRLTDKAARWCGEGSPARGGSATTPACRRCPLLTCTCRRATARPRRLTLTLPLHPWTTSSAPFPLRPSLRLFTMIGTEQDEPAQSARAFPPPAAAHFPGPALCA